MLTSHRPYTERVTMAVLCVAAAAGLTAHAPGGGPETVRSPASGHEDSRHGGSGPAHRVDGHHHSPSPPPRTAGNTTGRTRAGPPPTAHTP
ncbi:hypothetical protein KBZ10_22525 [Streptomyces sp. F63]|uniref:hypothetical protein n=1 Tax=Streptomyces sp. F63 TaxID=2824887 RepID=UPI001B3657DD|nr:hypothetical protein [Streptomyces sp. F63]MBQ0987243.1 hypothetical protein [Streptomyces sp. F63]